MIFPALSVLDGAESDQVLAMIKSVNDILVEIHGRLQNATNASVNESGDPAAVENTCRVYCSRLEEYRTSLTTGMECLQRFVPPVHCCVH